MTTGPHVRAQLPALQRVSTVEAVATTLRDQILDGNLPAGQPLREADLSEQLRVSRHSVRVALSNLTHEGLVRHEPNRGAFVRDMSTHEIADCYRLRSILELEAARTLCGDTAALSRARAAVQRLVDTPTDSPWAAQREADLAFHRELVDALGSPLISRTYESLMMELRLCFLVEGVKDKDPEVIAQTHVALLEILESGDVDEAVRVLTEHLDSSRDDAIEALRSRHEA
ncbi:GntR family transcriptional regulator [Streptomyces sp. DT2A-34]|uniref:GntR family transcriptional regulator n=1 Tax=Streptomyces sp. DT2A-34 TaxID=3051182 RepID=UPI00265C7902|nr:GntR family transcriptional regulator [Streptomyces sp. DT2A-34]MDO0916656.1 GntR family transcriptional regulator [Streptomyces sp. DT2A-34]